MNNEIDNLKKRLIYRSQYRGTKEMDKLIGNFVQANIDKLNNIQLKKLEKFLEIDDDTLYKYYNGLKVESKIDQSEILKLFKNYNFK
ncbi:succinate dehydrogenase assembly factor 2 [Candidatus Pelagibacter sp.]|nr:succinate dehydrogenase assembly factor 2 [Candidatus Pelagibacter sp.]